MSYDRYTRFRVNGTIKIVPGITIDPKSTDYFETYTLGLSRLDIISSEYYGDPNYDWLIMQANPQYGSLEFNIENKSLLRIPYPLETTMSQYYSDIDKYKELYGFK
jgi:hypothetical protein